MISPNSGVHPIKLDKTDPSVSAVYEKLLREKLMEECTELNEAAMSGSRDNVVEEAADVVQVVEAILSHHQLTWNDLQLVKANKQQERGGFEDCLVLPTPS